MEKTRTKVRPEINPKLYGQLIFDEEARMCIGKRTVSSTTGIEKSRQQHAKE